MRLILPNKYLLFSVLSILIFLSSCVSRKAYNARITEKHSVKKVQRDVDFAYNQLKKGHAGVYWYIEKQQLDFKFDSLKKSINEPLTSLELYRKLAPVIAEVRCGHTRLFMPNMLYSKMEKKERAKVMNPLQQLKLNVVDEKLYVTGLNNSLNLVKEGDQILAIEDEPIDQIFNNLKSVFASDGYNETFKNAALNRTFSNVYSLLYDVPKSLHYKIKRGDSIHYVALNTIVKKDSVAKTTEVKKSINKKPDADSLAKLKQKYKLEKQRRYLGKDGKDKTLLEFKILDSTQKIAYIKVKSFSFPYANFNKFFKESFQAIKDNDIEHLVLDIRENGGGSLAACKELFGYLVKEDFNFIAESRVPRLYNPYIKQKGVFNWFKALTYYINRKHSSEQESFNSYLMTFDGTDIESPRKNHYDKNLYVLINGFSFSASSLLAANLQENRDAIFVGQETGGAINGCVAGHIPGIILPNSGLQLKMGLYAIKPAFSTTDYGRGIFPNVWITPNYSDFSQKRDPELNWILNDIKLKN